MMMPMIHFDQSICRDWQAATGREWLETNGLGGFASSTIAGVNTRRYHGLLVAATAPPVGRLVLLSKLEETLIIDSRRFDLSANQYAGAVHPRGYESLVEFRLDPFPTFTYKVAGIRLEKSVLMIHGENTTLIEYRVQKLGGEWPRELRLEVRPLIAFRDYHSTTHENNALNPHVSIQSGLASVTPYEGLPTLHLAHNGEAFEPTGCWYRNFEYPEEQARGLDFREDLYSPGAFYFDLLRRPQPCIIASTEPHDIRRAADDRQSEIDRRVQLTSIVASDNQLVRSLVVAADQFIVARGREKTVIAGYHWFSDWGRDTMIALPGLTLTTGHFDVARSILLEFARHVDRGMLPNRFPDAGEQPEYNTVDATLWYFEAVRALLERTGDYDFIKANLYSVLADIIDWHERGTRYGIRVDADGLLLAGEAGVQLTWMDAKIGEWVVTPRTGKAVEIQALWYNALCVMKQLARAFGDAARERHYHKSATRAKASFNQLFWNEEAGCLYDVVDGEMRDATMRPNQILAVSLPHSMLSRERARQVVDVVRRELLTPVGLRSLSPRDPQYRARYEGDSFSRDSAYHQGTVWAWLIGPFISAYLKVNEQGEASRQQAAEWLTAFASHLNEAGVGQVSEIFDGNAPHGPRGCVAQAWSVATLLQAAEEVFALKFSKAQAAPVL
jgi:predicted glycogen debranching enzyme